MLAGQHFGLFVASPFTQPAVVQAAMQFRKADCVQPRPAEENDGSGTGTGTDSSMSSNIASSGSKTSTNGQEQQPQQAGQPPLLGKMPLRLAFPEVPVRWRGKIPIEVRCLSCCIFCWPGSSA